MKFGDYIRCGERGYNLEREVNRRFGVNANKDALPKRLTQTLQDPNDPNSKVPLERLKKVYYHARGWDKNGLPTEETLKKLKISFAAKAPRKTETVEDSRGEAAKESGR